MSFAEEFAALTAAVRQTLDGSRAIDPERHRRLAERYAQAVAELGGHPDEMPQPRAFLTLVEQGRWAELALRHGWPLPEKAAPHSVPRAWEAFSADQLARWYRAHIRSLGLIERAQVLQRLADLDSGDRSWSKELRALEPDLVRELKKSAARAVKTRSVDGLEAVFDQLTSPQLAGRVDSELVERCRRELNSLRSDELRRHGLAVLELIEAARAEEDFEALESRLDYWESRIARRPEFAAAGIPAERLEAPTAWLHGRLAERARRQEFDRAQESLTRQLESQASPDDLEKTLARIAATGLSADPELTAGARNRIAAVRARQARRRLVRSLAGAVLALAILGLTALILIGVRNNREYRNLVEQLNLELDAGRLDDAGIRLEQATARRPEWLNDPVIAAIADRRRLALENRDERRRQLHQSFARLEAMEEEETPDLFLYERELEWGAGFLDEEDGADTRRLEGFREYLRRGRDEERRRRDREDLEQVHTLTAAMDEFRDSAQADDYAECERRIGEFRVAYAALQQTLPERSQAASALLEYAGSLDAWWEQRRLEEQRREEIAAAKRALTADASDLRGFGEELAGFAARYRELIPGDPIVRAAGQWEDFITAGSLSRYNAMTPLSYDALRKEVESFPAGSYWEGLVAELDGLLAGRQAARDEAGQVFDLDTEYLGLQCIRFTASDGRVREFYSLYTLDERPRMAGSNDSTEISARVYDAPGHTAESRFVSVGGRTRWKVSIGRSLLELDGFKLDDIQAMPFSAMLKNFTDAARVSYESPHRARAALCLWLHRLAADAALNPGIKYRIFEQCLDQLTGHGLDAGLEQEFAGTWQELARLNNDGELNAFMLTPEQFSAGNRLFAGLPLAAMADGYGELDAYDPARARILLLESTLSLQLRPAGLTVDTGEGVRPFLAGGAESGMEVWALEFDDDGFPLRSLKIGATADRAVVPDAGIGPLEEGLWLYLIPASVEAAGKIRAVRRLLPPGGKTDWPALWPANLISR